MENHTDSPLVSVIMPVFNGEKYLREAIESILSQTYHPFEVIVVDDGSTDGTSRIVSEYGGPITYISKEHSGLGDTLNRGIAEARGEYLTFLDADDVWMENKLALQIAVIEKRDVDMVFGYMQQFISPELDEKDRSSILCQDEPIPGYSSSAMLVRKASFFKVGLFSTNYRLGEFIDWYLRAKRLGLRWLMLPDVIVKRRLHKTNMTAQKASDKLDYVRIVKASLDHRRKNK
ncbi:MAG: glycosyltransferase [Chloroflexi bacterium]|nr:glycosyltransferase [Chloroflexota bacterium]